MEDLQENAALERFENHCREVACISRKLSRKNIPPGKRATLVFRQGDLNNRIIPRDVQNIGN